MEEKVYIIILNYKTHDDTLECLESIFELTYPRFQVILVDNASDNGSVEKIQDWFMKRNDVNLVIVSDQVECFIDVERKTTDSFLICSHKNRGYAGGNNLGLKLAQSFGDMGFAWIINNDTVLHTRSLGNVMAEIECKRMSADFVGTILLDYNNQSHIQARGGRLNRTWLSTSHLYEGVLYKEDNKYYQKPDYPIGASILFSKKLLDVVGLLDEAWFLYYEELDMVERAKIKGFDFSICDTAIVYHKESISIGDSHIKSEKSFIADYYSIKNRIRYTRMYHPKKLVFVYFSMIFVIVNRIRRGQLDRIWPIIKILLAQ